MSLESERFLTRAAFAGLMVAISLLFARGASADPLGVGRPLAPLHPGGLALIGPTRASALSAAGRAADGCVTVGAAKARARARLAPVALARAASPIVLRRGVRPATGMTTAPKRRHGHKRS